MAKIGNEARLILKLAGEKHSRLRDSRVNTLLQPGYSAGYDRCYSDIWMILDGIVTDIETK